MNPTCVIVRPLEGLTPLDGPQPYETWPEAAAHLRMLCERNPDPFHYLKTEVILQFPDGAWERRRFDAQKGEEGSLKDVKTFRSNSLLYCRYPAGGV